MVLDPNAADVRLVMALSCGSFNYVRLHRLQKRHSMLQAELYEAIFKRRSVRNFTQGPLNAETLAKIDAFISDLRPLFSGIRTEIRTMTSVEVKGMFKVEAPHFLAFFSEAKEGYLANAGFMLQQVDLFLSANGLGSCWQGGPKPVGKTRGASELEFVTLLAFGAPAEDPHRKSVSEFKREPLAKMTDVKGHDDLLEPARLAPSAMNNQPWRFTGGDGTLHAYSAKSLVMGRINQISVGIALCHLWLAGLHAGKTVATSRDESGAESAPKRYSYIASLAMK